MLPTDKSTTYFEKMKHFPGPLRIAGIVRGRTGIKRVYTPGGFLARWTLCYNVARNDTPLYLEPPHTISAFASAIADLVIAKMIMIEQV